MGVLRVLADNKKVNEKEKAQFEEGFKELLAKFDTTPFEPFLFFYEDKLLSRWEELEVKSSIDDLLPLAEDLIIRSGGDVSQGTCLGALRVYQALRKNLRNDNYEFAASLGQLLVDQLGLDNAKVENSGMSTLYLEIARCYWGTRNWEKACMFYAVAVTRANPFPNDFADCAYVHLKVKSSILNKR